MIALWRRIRQQDAIDALWSQVLVLERENRRLRLRELYIKDALAGGLAQGKEEEREP